MSTLAPAPGATASAVDQGPPQGESRVWPVVSGLALLATGALAMAMWALLPFAASMRPLDVLLLVTLQGAIILLYRVASVVTMPSPGERLVITFEELALFGVFALMPPLIAPLLLLPASILDQVFVRRRGVKAVFNVVNGVTSAGAAALVAAGGLALGLPAWAAAAPATLAYAVLVDIGLAGIFARISRESWLSAIRSNDFRPALVSGGVCALLGVLLYALASLHPLLLLLTIPGVLVIRAQLSLVNRAVRETQAHERLVQVGQAVAGVDEERIAREVLAAAEDLLLAAEVRLDLRAKDGARAKTWSRRRDGRARSDAPLTVAIQGPGGVHMGVLTTWPPIYRLAPYDADDRALLTIVAAHAAAAFENARALRSLADRSERLVRIADLARAALAQPSAARSIEAAVDVAAKTLHAHVEVSLEGLAAASDRTVPLGPPTWRIPVGDVTVPLGELRAWIPGGASADDLVFLRAVSYVAASAREREKTEGALREGEKLNALGTLVAGVAHEVNNPLTYMQGSAELSQLALRELADSHEFPEATRAQIGEILADVDRILHGIHQIADITRSLKRVARKGAGAREPEDINQLMRSVLLVAKPRFSNRTNVETDLRASRPVQMNSGEIAQVMLNLLLNAADVLSERGGNVFVKTFEEGQETILEVSDDGPGIPPGVQARLFTPFFTTKHEGTGLGLSLSRRIAEDHGGALTFTSKLGAGTTFRLRLPAQEAPTATAPAPGRA